MRIEVHVESRWYSISKTLICSRVKRRLCFALVGLLCWQSPPSSSWESLISDFVLELALFTCFWLFLECTFLSSSSDYMIAGYGSVASCFLSGEGFKCTILSMVDCRHTLLCIICIFVLIIVSNMLSLAFSGKGKVNLDESELWAAITLSSELVFYTTSRSFCLFRVS